MAVIPPRSLVYFDASVLVRAVLLDEGGHHKALAALAASRGRGATWEMAQVEAMCGLRAAERARRVRPGGAVEADLAAAFTGPEALMLLPSTDPSLVEVAVDIASRRRLRALDSMHIAVALVEATRLATGWPVCFVTADRDQARAARAEGLKVVTV